jgi:hypothetical protein
MSLSTGDIGPPCGVPSSVEMIAPSTIAPALSHFPISLRIAESAIRWATAEDRDFARGLDERHHAIVRNVRPDEITARREAGGTFRPARPDHKRSTRTWPAKQVSKRESTASLSASPAEPLFWTSDRYRSPRKRVLVPQRSTACPMCSARALRPSSDFYRWFSIRLVRSAPSVSCWPVHGKSIPGTAIELLRVQYKMSSIVKSGGAPPKNITGRKS